MDIESTLSGHNLAFLEALYEAYQRDPNSIDPDWLPVLRDLERKNQGEAPAPVRRAPAAPSSTTCRPASTS
jgi:2-oxoglutarate dehydrogenase E1 component